MTLTSYADQILATAQTELDRLLADFQSTPSCAGLFDIGGTAEILVLAQGLSTARILTSALANAASGWLRSGLLEDIFFARSGLGYHTALLCYVAWQGCGQQDRELRVVERMFNARLIGRNESAILTQQVIGTYLSLCGIDVDLNKLGKRDLVTMIDKRVLRTRSDEYDLLVLIMGAQLLRLKSSFCLQRKPKLFPHVLLAQAIRSCNLNWIPVLAFLCAIVYGLPTYLEVSATECLSTAVPLTAELLPPPKDIGYDSEYIQRATRGLRLRSTIALALYVDHLMDPPTS